MLHHNGPLWHSQVCVTLITQQKCNVPLIPCASESKKPSLRLFKCYRFPAYYNNCGTNGGAGPPGSQSGGPPASAAQGSAPGSYGSYYQNDVGGGYAAASAAKPPKKKLPLHKAGKPPFAGPLGGNLGPAGLGYQSGGAPGQGSYSQYGQGYGQGKKGFNQNPGGAGGYSYSTAYPSQVTGSGGGGQDYSYEGE